jgi:hypothetical protein
MSLQLWLPLNGDLTNNGLMDTDVASTRLTYTEDGKIGKCARFNNNTYIDLGSVSVGKEFSICGWFNIVTHNVNWATCVQLYNSDTNLISFCTLYNTTQNFASFNAQKNGTYIFDKYQFPFALNQWNHFCVTVKDKKVNMYVNGKNSYQGDMTDTPLYGEYKLRIGNRFIGSYYPDFKLNDFRVYDHCLSPKEVKEISKGLMLHYPLNNNGMGCKNLLAGNFNAVATQEGNSHSGSLWIHTDNIGGSFNNLIGKTLIFSYEVSAEGSRYYVNTGDLRPRFGIHGTIQYVANGSSATVYPFADYLMYSGGARKVVMKYTIPSTWTSISNFTFALQDTNRPAAGNTATWYIKNCKLEIADEATPWCPNVRDELYSQLGMDENIEYDVSGYGYNGTKIGSLNYESGSPRYNTSSYFNGTDACIKVPELTLDFNNITFSMWYKPSGARSFARLFDFSMGSEGNSTTFLIAHYGTNMQLCVHGRYPNKNAIYATGDYVHPIVANTWYHVACTVAGTVCKWYIDGKLVMTKTMAQNIGVVTFVNNYLAESTWAADPLNKCNLSDFRVYATCLSETDIQELYNKPISIDNNGNLFAQEIIEEISSASKFEKNGIVRADNISRCLYNYFNYDNTAMQIQSVNSKVSLTKLPENNGFKLTCNSALSSEAMSRTQQLLFNGVSGQFKVEFDAWATNSVTIVPDICDRDSGTYTLTSIKQHFSGVASNVNSYNTSSAYNGFFDIKCSGTVSAGTEIYITNIVISKNTPKSVGNNFIIMDDIIEN